MEKMLNRLSITGTATNFQYSIILRWGKKIKEVVWAHIFIGFFMPARQQLSSCESYQIPTHSVNPLLPHHTHTQSPPHTETITLIDPPHPNNTCSGHLRPTLKTTAQLPQCGPPVHGHTHPRSCLLEAHSPGGRGWTPRWARWGVRGPGWQRPSGGGTGSLRSGWSISSPPCTRPGWSRTRWCLAPHKCKRDTCTRTANECMVNRFACFILRSYS